MLAISIDFSLSYFHHNFTKNQQKNVEKTMENQKGTFFDVKTLQVRVFFAPGSLLEVSGSDLGTSQELVGGSFGRPWRSPGASGRPSPKLGVAPGAPEMSWESREPFWVDFGCPGWLPGTLFDQNCYRFWLPQVSLSHTICHTLWKV